VTDGRTDGIAVGITALCIARNAERCMNFDVSFCNGGGVKLIKVAFYVSQGNVAT